MHCTKRITDDMIWVGADDRRLSLFEGVYGVPEGVSYNSYLILDEQTVLFDTVDKAVAHNFFDNVAYGLEGRKLDYLVISHMEPDHAATIEDIALRYPEAKIVCNAKIRDMLARFFPTDLSERLHIVKEGDTLSTGRHVFTFVMAPMVHWPEVMMTYDSTDKILFSADAFGSFGALNGRIFADEVDFMHECIDEARRYYTNIVGKYGPQVQAALRKAAGLDIKYVCPLHSFVWRQGFGDFLAKYDQWSSYTPEVKGVLIAYASVYGHTENAANILAAKLSDRGVKVKMYDTSVTPARYILSDAFKYSHMVLAATTYNAGVFVTMEQLIHELVSHNLQNRKVALIENGSWAPTSGGLMKKMLSELKGTEFIGGALTVKSALTEDQLGDLDALADAIAADVLPPKPVPVEVKIAETKGSMDGVFEVDNAAFNKFSYGCEILTTRVDGKDYGCVINTAGQITSSDPKKITISCIKANHTCDMVGKAGIFNLSILSEDVPYDVFKHFGFQSGRDVDKFADWPDELRTQNGVRYIGQHVNAVLSARVIDARDCGTQMLYIAEVVEAHVLSDKPSCTYSYYHAHIKPKKAPAPPAVEGWICKVCGYFYEGAELPADFVCPLCKHGPEDFEHYVPAVVNKKKGWLCTICGHFYEGETLPADYVCPICHHGADAFEPAEQ
ncbi:MAG TPA: flavin reductase [Candidatus Scatomorpha merdigallinarum]|nr:flavin reductase [Candidatus Scatomorpha merdigallinarum]